MNKHTKSISLVLLGSAVMISGCSPSVTEQEGQGGDWGEPLAETQAGTQGEGSGRSAVGVGAGIGVGRMLSRGIGGGRSAGMAPSARGGFGGNGGFSVGS